MFWNKYVLRWNLLHFETILRNVTVVFYSIFQSWSCFLSYSVLRQGILTSRALTSSRLDDFFSDSYLYTVMIIIYFWGGGKQGNFFLGGGTYPSNTLDRTLLAVPEAFKTQMTRWSNILTNKPQNILNIIIPVCRNQKALSLEEGCL